MRAVLGDCVFEAKDYDGSTADFDKWKKAVDRRERRRITDNIAELEAQLQKHRKMLREFDKTETD